MSELWLVEWSDEQQTFHVEPIDTPGLYKATLRRLISTGTAGDWTVLAIAATNAEAHCMIEEIESLMKKPINAVT